MVVLGLVFTVFCQPVAALPGTDSLIYSPNITLNEDAPAYTEFSTAFDLDGNKLVWMNIWAERKTDARKDTIYLLDLQDNESRILTQTPGSCHEHSFDSSLSFSNGTLVWTELLKDDIFEYFVPDQEEQQITSDGSVEDLTEEWKNKNPMIEGDRVVWAKKKPAGTREDYDIVLMNISNGVLQEICTSDADQTNPYISGSRIVWADKRNEPDGGDIYLFDLDTRREMPVCTDTGSQKYPKLFNDTVIWRDYRDGGPEVYIFDLSSGKESRISDPAYDAGEPFIWGNYVAWTEYLRFDRRDTRSSRICVYDISEGSREILPVSTSYPLLLDLDRDRILYEDPDQDSMKTGYLHLFVIDTAVRKPDQGVVSSGIPGNNATGPVELSPVTPQSPVSVLMLIFALGCGVFAYRKM
jgi:beta propeller repeat protein